MLCQNDDLDIVYLPRILPLKLPPLLPLWSQFQDNNVVRHDVQQVPSTPKTSFTVVRMFPAFCTHTPKISSKNQH